MTNHLNRKAQRDLILSMVISVGGVVIASAKPTDWWEGLVLIVGIAVTVAGTLKANRDETPTFLKKKSKGDQNGST